MKVSCIGCGNRNWEIDVNDLTHVKVITFVCPECNEFTAVAERSGGGVLIAKDQHAQKQR